MNYNFFFVKYHIIYFKNIYELIVKLFTVILLYTIIQEFITFIVYQFCIKI